MLTRIQALLDKLYSNTDTPKVSGEYLSNPDILSYIERTFHKISRKNPSYNFLYQEVEAIALFLLNLMDTRTILEGVLLVEPSVIYMVEQGIARVKAEPLDAQQIIDVRDTWYGVLKDVPKKVKNFYNHEPNYESCPLLTFHTTAYRHSLQPDKTAPLYTAYAYKLHTDIRFNQKQNIDVETHLAYVRPARFFFEFLSPSIKQQKYHPPDRIPSSYVGDFIQNLLKNKSIARATVKGHIDNFRGLIRRKKIKAHPRISLRTSHNVKILASSALPHGVPMSGDVPPRFLIHGFPKERPTDKYALLDFVDDIDFGYVSFPDSPRLLRLSDESETYKHSMDYIHVRNFAVYWDVQYLNLFHYAILYHAIDEAIRKSPQLRSIALFLYMLIHTGIDAEKLLKTVPVQGYPAHDAVGLKIMDGRYYLLNPCIIHPTNPDLAHDCLPTATHVHIPVPEVIADLIPPDAMNRSHLFSFLQDKREILLSSYDIKDFLSKVNKNFAVYDLHITMGHIENSFLPLYSSRYGLDPIICCHINGKDRHQLYGSQLHYIYVPHVTLASRYLESFSVVDHQIRRNLNACIGNKLIDGKTRIISLKKDSPLQNVASIAGYGSTGTAPFSSVKDLIGRLHDAVRVESNIVKRHNLFNSYLFLGIQFSTGYRPLSRPIIPWHLYNDRSGMLVIRDKDSAEFHEQRILPLPSVMKSLLAKLRTDQHAFNDFVVRNLYITDQTEIFERIFFLVDKSGRFVDFTLDMMLEVLRDVSIDYPLPMNMPRHYLRNHLYHLGISNDLADAWLGHQRDGREMLNITSSTLVPDALRHCLRVVEDMMAQIGFSDVRYVSS